MPYDIYGQPLEKGFCEVHPWVREGYPCSLCHAEANIKAKKREIERETQRSIEQEKQRHLEQEMEPPPICFLISVHAAPNYSHSWIAMASNPKEAINKLNYQLRVRARAYKANKDDGNASYLKEWINALRRYRRTYKKRFGGVHSKALSIYELPEHFVYSVSYFEVVHRDYVGQILPEIQLREPRPCKD